MRLWLALLFSVPLAATDLTGVYTIDREGTRVEIYRCGVEYCGKLLSFTALSEHRIKEFTPLEKRHAGMKMLWGILPAGKGAFRGQLYSPQDGRIFYCRIEPTSRHLRVRSSMDPWGIVGRTRTWSRI
ncbi:MAG: DUF2147 domain-containing protein [Spirochaetales bacterium]|nr:DUF2147 domain-containing protein [Spirochaetales bacterium]